MEFNDRPRGGGRGRGRSNGQGKWNDGAPNHNSDRRGRGGNHRNNGPPRNTNRFEEDDQRRGYGYQRNDYNGGEWENSGRRRGVGGSGGFQGGTWNNSRFGERNRGFQQEDHYGSHRNDNFDQPGGRNNFDRYDQQERRSDYNSYQNENRNYDNRRNFDQERQYQNGYRHNDNYNGGYRDDRNGYGYNAHGSDRSQRGYEHRQRNDGGYERQCDQRSYSNQRDNQYNPRQEYHSSNYSNGGYQERQEFRNNQRQNESDGYRQQPTRPFGCPPDFVTRGECSPRGGAGFRGKQASPGKSEKGGGRGRGRGGRGGGSGNRFGGLKEERAQEQTPQEQPEQDLPTTSATVSSNENAPTTVEKESSEMAKKSAKKSASPPTQPKPVPAPSTPQEPPIPSGGSPQEVTVEQLIQSTSRMAVSNEDEFVSRTTIAEKKPRANRADKEIVKLKSNFYQMTVKPKIVYRYDINVTVLTGAGGKNPSLAKGARDDAARTERNQICLTALRQALDAYGVLRQGEAIVYDNASILYSSQSLSVALKPHSNTLSISLEDLPDHIRRLIRIPQATGIAIEINPCADGASEFNTSDYKNAHSNRDMASLDRSFKQFFDMLTNQDVVNSDRYTLFGSGMLYSNKAPRMSAVGGQERIPGANKGIKFINASGKPNDIVAALVLDAKLGQFFKSQTLTQTVCEFMNWRNGMPQSFHFKDRNQKPSHEWKEINNYIKGLRMLYHNGNTEASFVANGISRVPLGELKEENFRGEMQSVFERFPNLRPQDVNTALPAVLIRGKVGNKFVCIHYPMELLTVAANQRVPLHKQQGIPPRADKPDVRNRNIEKLMGELNLDSYSNPILKAFGVHIDQTPITVDAIRRDRPQISTGRGMAQVDKEKANWRMDVYKQPAVADHVIIAYDCDQKTANDAKGAMARMMGQRGMTAKNWDMLQVRPNGDQFQTLKTMFQTITERQKNKVYQGSIVVIYIDNSNRRSHGFLKLLERQFKILTQHLTTEVAQKMVRQSETCSNVINKLNCKLTGLNYAITPDKYSKNAWITNNRSLIVGYDVAHPPAQTRSEVLDNKPPSTPSVVGFGFNGGKHGESFIGDFHYQTPKKEEVTDRVLNVRMKWILELFVKNRGGVPANIFIVRDGVSEGQYQMVLDREMFAIREACEEFGNMKNLEDWNPKFVCIIVTKRHNARFVRDFGRGRIENAMPGTVVDDTITRGDATEFYMQSHRVIQGTGKMPSYVVLQDDIGLSQDVIQSFMLALCFDHQINGSPISLPEPVYQADEWAKRGSDIWKAFEEVYTIPKCEEKGSYCEKPNDYEKMTQMMGYWNTPLQETRVNA